MSYEGGRVVKKQKPVRQKIPLSRLKEKSFLHRGSALNQEKAK